MEVEKMRRKTEILSESSKRERCDLGIVGRKGVSERERVGERERGRERE